MDKRDERPVTLVHIVRPEATLTVELPERAVRALAIIGAFGEDALEKAVATVLSPSEAKRHSYGFTDLTRSVPSRAVPSNDLMTLAPWPRGARSPQIYR